MTIDSFIDKLAKTAVSPNVTNPYACQPGSHSPNLTRCHNLRVYLHHMAAAKPEFLLVGEAPGYRGARLTGIPFVSPHLLTLLSVQLGTPPLTPAGEWPHIQKEASATIMWETLAQVTAVPLIWNAFPFHPHQPANPQSNRRPNQKEVALGMLFLQELHSLFKIHTIIAVGTTASQALTRWHIHHEKVRHPSHGGKQQFQAELIDLLD